MALLLWWTPFVDWGWLIELSMIRKAGRVSVIWDVLIYDLSEFEVIWNAAHLEIGVGECEYCNVNVSILELCTIHEV